jgi:hypothetical protein
MMIEMGTEVLEFLAWLVGLGMWICIRDADGFGIGGSWDWQHFFQTTTSIRKIVSTIRIMGAGEVNIQCASVTGRQVYE